MQRTIRATLEQHSMFESAENTEFGASFACQEGAASGHIFMVLFQLCLFRPTLHGTARVPGGPAAPFLWGVPSCVVVCERAQWRGAKGSKGRRTLSAVRWRRPRWKHRSHMQMLGRRMARDAGQRRHLVVPVVLGCGPGVGHIEVGRQHAGTSMHGESAIARLATNVEA